MAVLIECPKCRMKQKATNKRCTKCEANIENAKKSGKARYWVHFRVAGKQKVELVVKRDPESNQVVPGTYEDAKLLDGERNAQRQKTPEIFEKKPEYTFKKLSEWYLGLLPVKKLAYYGTLQVYLKKFNSEFGDILVDRIKPADLQNLQTKRKDEGCADSTVDQELAAAKVIINRAFDNDLISGEAVKVFKKVKKLLKRNSNARDKILSPDEFQRLMDNAPRHTKLILLTAFYTGMRRGEILSLTWDKLDLKKKVIRLDATDTKDKEARTIPICDELLRVLKAIPRPIHDLDKKLVFAYNRKNRRGKGEDDPLTDIRSGLEDACKKAGIPYGRFVKDGFIFHDLRHTFNTHMRKAGVAESVIMEITGHSTREMFDRYNTVDADDKAEAIRQFQGFVNGARKPKENGQAG